LATDTLLCAHISLSLLMALVTIHDFWFITGDSTLYENIIVPGIIQNIFTP
jgi:hypothetical protein